MWKLQILKQRFYKIKLLFKWEVCTKNNKEASCSFNYQKIFKATIFRESSKPSSKKTNCPSWCNWYWWWCHYAGDYFSKKLSPSNIFLHQICDLAKCCTTSKLSHTLSSEWVKNKQETWDGRKLGNCSDILFKSDATSLEVAVIKTIKKKQPLEITSIVLETAPTNDKKKIEK